MPLRKTLFANNQYYHVLNRGVGETQIFENSYGYQRFINLMNFYRFEDTHLSFSKYMKLPSTQKIEFENNLQEEGSQQIEIFAYCLMPNHFHILLKQILNGGTQKFLRNIQNGYAKYFNLKYKRYGPLFQSRFKAKVILNDEIFLHISRYIHLNPTTSFLISTEKLSSYPWSSLSEFLKAPSASFVNTNFILKMTGGKNNYKKFVYDHVDYQRKLQTIKHLLLEK